MDELGLWNFIHGTGAGCASIVAWEGSHMLLSGGVAVVVFGGVTVLIMHAVHRHRLLLQRRRRHRARRPTVRPHRVG